MQNYTINSLLSSGNEGINENLSTSPDDMFAAAKSGNLKLLVSKIISIFVNNNTVFLNFYLTIVNKLVKISKIKTKLFSIAIVKVNIQNYKPVNRPKYKTLKRY